MFPSLGVRAIIGTRKGELVGVANSRCLDFSQNLALFRTFEADLNDFEWLCLLERNCRTGFHNATSQAQYVDTLIALSVAHKGNRGGPFAEDGRPIEIARGLFGQGHGLMD